jgi:hypothetical protein
MLDSIHALPIPKVCCEEMYFFSMGGKFPPSRGIHIFRGARGREATNEDNNLHLTSEIASTFLIIFLLYFQIYFYIFFWQFASWFSGLLSPFLFGKKVYRGFLHWTIFYLGIYLIWRFSYTELIFMTCPLLQFSFPLSHWLLA